MRLLPFVAAASATTVMEHTESVTGTTKLCNSHSNGVSSHNSTVSDEVTLEAGESCIYRLMGDGNEIMSLLDAQLELDCGQGEMWLFTATEEFGPFCSGERHRRGADYSMDIGGLNGNSFQSDEVDMVFKNGQGFKFSFAFQFQFEFLPGLPGQGDMCSYKPIQESNEFFAKSADGNSAATALWVQLTGSLYDFNCHFGDYEDQCTGFSPVRVSCNTMDWSGSCESMVVQAKAIINAQCSQCEGSTICAEWRDLWDQLMSAVDGGNSGYNYNDNTTPQCDADQCADGSHKCDAYATCDNNCNGYTCACVDGYNGDGYQCAPNCDADQCEGDVCPDNASCTNMCTGYECNCDSGYHMEGGVCEKDCDADQCNTSYGLPNPCPANSICVNKCDAYQCDCMSGFHKDGDQCLPDCDANQCNANPCPARATCQDDCSGYTCNCKAGFTMEDDECCDKDQCGAKPCPANSSCDNLCIGFKCTCDANYHKKNGRCVPDCDADQCLKNNGDCPQFSTCENQCDGNSCKCDAGYTMKSGECCDENQCNTVDNVCGAYSTCINKCHGFSCFCDAGYIEDNGTCVPICDEDQCKSANACPAYSDCTNECSGHKCECWAGYTMSNGECVQDCDENQCNSNSACGANMSCTNKCQGFECKCKKNHIPVNGGGCKHKDPCNNVKCGDYQKCKNGQCLCSNGYYPDSSSGICMEKTNECITGEHNCHKYATCTDTLAGYTCACNAAYKDTSANTDGTDCTHPYYTETGSCNLHEYSAFTDDKFTAIAYTSSYAYQDAIAAWKAITAELSKLGEVAMTAREAVCADDAGIIGCLLIDYTKDATACAWAHTLETVVGEVAKKCNPDWTVKINLYIDALRKATCVEPDDCASGDHNCDANAVCTSKQATYGKETSGYKCNCNAGYYGNGKTCFPDVNECLGGHKCAPDATCQDTQTGYNCNCNTGYVGNGYICSIPVNECADKTHNCDVHAKCTDLPNGFQCKCDAHTGYYGNGQSCSGPADECLDGTHTCHNDAICTNTYAGFTCACPAGWYGDGKNCWPPLTCPWNGPEFHATYGGDFDNGLCSLKYSKICTASLYNDLVAGGTTFCQGSYAFQQFNIFMNEMFSFGKIYEKKYGIATSHIDNNNRYGAECAPEAGAVPCELVNFHDVTGAQDLFNRINNLFDHVFGQCSPTYKAKWEQWLARYHNALICPINECITGAATCHANAKCVDMAMGYDCVCKEHYHGDGHDDCAFIDYCANNNICTMYSTCANTNPGYTCTCNPGYYKYGNKCVAEDPCKKDNGGCSAQARCTSKLIGAEYNHYCTCKAGHFGDGFTCQPIDPCAVNNCDADAACIPYSNVVTQADYNCKCNAGFEGNGFICAAITDPCAGKTCGANASHKVTTVFGQKACNCVCNKGYKGDGVNCTPTDPCMNNDCHQHANCSPDVAYGFKCSCKTGYLGDGKTCTYDDPCDQCHAYAECGADQVCRCKNGYIGDGFVCRLADSCARACPSGTNCVDGDCQCSQSGYIYNFDSYRCEDDNECASGKNNCNSNALCQNLQGGFRCTCKSGFTGDGVTCNANNQGSGYDQGGNPYADGGKVVAEPTKNPKPSGLDVSIYSELSDGECSLMGFDWENLQKMLYKMTWSSYKAVNQGYVKTIFDQFATLGKSALARSGPMCDPKKAGVVPCKYLYFPHTEHRCQLVKRTARIFNDVVQHCNTAWKEKYGAMMNYMLQTNKSGKDGKACEKVKWLN